MDAIEQINAIIVVKGKKGQLGICWVVAEIEAIEDEDINGMEALWEEKELIQKVV